MEMLLGVIVLPQILLNNVSTGLPGSPSMNSTFGYLLFGQLELKFNPFGFIPCGFILCDSSVNNDFDLKQQVPKIKLGIISNH